MDHHAFNSAIQKVFLVFGAFWVVVIAVLLIAVGPLTKKWGTGGHGHGDKH